METENALWGSEKGAQYRVETFSTSTAREKTGQWVKFKGFKEP